MTAKLNIRFKKAFEKISSTDKKFPPDIMLKLYAYYKQATAGDNFTFSADFDTRSGFKFNAWMQLKGMSEDQAKEEYINLVNNLLK